MAVMVGLAPTGAVRDFTALLSNRQEVAMLTLTGITQARRDRSLPDALKGSAIVGFCFALAMAFVASV